jgi:hypothetical protein
MGSPLGVLTGPKVDHNFVVLHKSLPPQQRLDLTHSSVSAEPGKRPEKPLEFSVGAYRRYSIPQIAETDSTSVFREFPRLCWNTLFRGSSSAAKSGVFVERRGRPRNQNAQAFWFSEVCPAWGVTRR